MVKYLSCVFMMVMSFVSLARPALLHCDADLAELYRCGAQRKMIVFFNSICRNPSYQDMADFEYRLAEYPELYQCFTQDYNVFYQPHAMLASPRQTSMQEALEPVTGPVAKVDSKQSPAQSSIQVISETPTVLESPAGLTQPRQEDEDFTVELIGLRVERVLDDAEDIHESVKLDHAAGTEIIFTISPKEASILNLLEDRTELLLFKDNTGKNLLEASKDILQKRDVTQNEVEFTFDELQHNTVRAQTAKCDVARNICIVTAHTTALPDVTATYLELIANVGVKVSGKMSKKSNLDNIPLTDGASFEIDNIPVTFVQHRVESIDNQFTIYYLPQSTAIIENIEFFDILGAPLDVRRGELDGKTTYGINQEVEWASLRITYKPTMIKSLRVDVSAGLGL